MKIFTFALLLIIWFSILFGINALIVKKLSYPKDKRFLHFRLVFISFLVAVSVSNNLSSSLLIPLLGRVLSLPSVSNIIFAIIPAREIEIVVLLLCLLILNMLYAVVHLIVIALYKALYKGKKDYDYVVYEDCIGKDRIFKFPWKIVNHFYEYDNSKARLKDSSYTLGVSIRFMKYICLFIWGLEVIAMFCTINFGIVFLSGFVLSVTKRFFLLPVALFFLFEQMQLFLEGPETEENGDIETTEISEKMMGNIQALIPCYLDIYSDSGVILCAEAGPKKEIKATDYHGNEAGNNQLIECKEPGISEILFGQLKMSGVEMNSGYQNAIIKLLNGDSVYVRDNVEGEFSAYYCAYISYFVSRGKSALIICADSKMAAKVRAELQTVFKNGIGMNALCKTAFVSELDSSSDANVIICSYSDLINMDFVLRYKELAEKFCFTVLADCPSFLELDNISIDIILSKLRSIPNPMRYAFISSVVNKNIGERIQGIFAYNNIGLESFSNDVRNANSNVMIWKEESSYNLMKSLEIGCVGSVYLGTALPLALVAIKNDFPKVYIIPGKRTGDFFFQKNATDMNSMDLDEYFNSKIDLKSVIIPRTYEATQKEELKVICVYDDNYNLFDCLRMWFKYSGENGSLIHVISPYYMLREFLSDNYRNFLNSSNTYGALYKEELCLNRSRLLKVLAKFADSDVDEKVIIRFVRDYGWEETYSGVSDLLLDAVKLLRSEANDIYDYFEIVDDSLYNRETNKIEPVRFFRMTDKELISELKAIVATTVAYINESSSIKTDILTGNVLNYYLPKQIVPFDGWYYQVDKVSNNGLLKLSPAAPNQLFDYYVVSDFDIDEARLIDECNDKHYLDFNIYEADITRNIYGYISSTEGNDFSASSEFMDFTSANYAVQRKGIPVLEIRINKSLFGDGKTDEGAVKLLSILFNGVFKTLFPNLYQNIIAVPNTVFDRELCNKILNNKNLALGEDYANLSIGGVNYSKIKPKRSDDYVSLYIVEFSCFEYGLINALYQDITEVLRIIYRYLIWYLDNDKGRYLHFGLDSIPSSLAANKLREILCKSLSMHEAAFAGEEAIDKFDAKYKIYKCSYCGCDSRFAWKLDDGRLMCGHCHNQIKTQVAEINAIFKMIRYSLETIYDVEFDKEINISFQSKDAIERVAGKSAGGRVVGFYKHLPKKQLWIERKGPSVAMQSTMAHELTHAWQFAELDLIQLEKVLGKNARKKMTVLQEGQSVFVQIDIMRHLGETRFADRLDDDYLSRNDEYGKGYKFFKEYYEAKNDEGGPYTPYKVMSMLVEDIIAGGDTSWLDELIK